MLRAGNLPAMDAIQVQRPTLERTPFGAVAVAWAARAVGNAHAANPFPLIMLCHRAIRSDGGLGGCQGGVAMKRALLAMEGVAVDGTGRVGRQSLHDTARRGVTSRRAPRGSAP